MTDMTKEQRWFVTGSLLVIAMISSAVIFHFAAAVLIPFVLAVFISFLVSPILDFQVLRLGFHRTVAIIITLLIVLAFLLVVLLFMIQAVQSIIAVANRYSNSFVSLVERVFAQFEHWDLKLNEEKIATDLKNQIPSFVTNSFGTVMDFISSTFLVSIFVIFLLIGRNPHAVRSGIYGEIDYRIRKYITTKTVISIITGVSVWVILSLFNLELASIFGILAFLLNYIPSIGSIIATMLPIPIAVAQFQNPWLIVAVVGIPGLIQLTMGNVVEPRIMGKELHLHPVTILLALSTWGLIWGIVGMFLAVPITAAIRIVLMQFETLEPVGKILAGEFPKIKSTSA